MVTAREFETAIPPVETDAEPQGEFEIRPRGWIKRVLPRTMFGRSLLIFIVPLVVLQAIATWVFYDRHWAAISWRLAAGVAGDIALVTEALQNAGSDTSADRLLQKAAAATDLDLKLNVGQKNTGQLPAAAEPACAPGQRERERTGHAQRACPHPGDDPPLRRLPVDQDEGQS